MVKEIIERNIVLETCPTSNIATKIYENYEAHPVKKLFDAGVKITVNSDDPPFFNASIAGEYEVMANLGLSRKELISLTIMQLNLLFVMKSTKEKLLSKLD